MIQDPVDGQLNASGLKVDATKSTFVTDSVKNLGYKLSRYALSPLPSKAEDSLAIPLLKTITTIIRYGTNLLWPMEQVKLFVSDADSVGEAGNDKQWLCVNAKKNFKWCHNKWYYVIESCIDC